MRWLAFVLLLCACETEEYRSWQLHREVLADQRAELLAVAAAPQAWAAKQLEVVKLRERLDVAAFARKHQVPARAFVDGDEVRFSVSGTAQACRDAIAPLGAVRWLVSEWRLRLQGDHCEWEAKTHPDVGVILYRLNAPPPPWTPPKSQLLTKDLAPLKAEIAMLERDLAGLKHTLGSLADMPRLERQLADVRNIVIRLEVDPSACDLAILDRELALDPPARGKLLEVSRRRLVHPLEPANDFRLRSMVEDVDGTLVWMCENR